MTFAGLDSQEYIAKKSIGDLSESYIQMVAIDEYLKNLYKKQLISGFEYRVLKSESDVYDEDLDIDAVKEISLGTFPCVWINITYKAEFLSKSQLQAIEEKFALISL
jgi:hypothetical protein